MKNKLFISVIFVLLCLVITGCGNKVISPTAKVTTTTIQSAWDFDYTTDDNKTVFNFNNMYYMVFFFDGDTVTDMWYVYDFKDVRTANTYVAIYRTQYKNDANGIKNVYRRGTSVIIEFEGSQYKDFTRNQIEASFSYLKTMYGK